METTQAQIIALKVAIEKIEKRMEFLDTYERLGMEMSFDTQICIKILKDEIKLLSNLL